MAEDDRRAARHRALAPPRLPLTGRERDVLALVAAGASNAAIADALHISRSTAELHLGRVFDKLGLPAGPEHNRRVLATLAYVRARAAQPAA